MKEGIQEKKALEQKLENRNQTLVTTQMNMELLKKQSQQENEELKAAIKELQRQKEEEGQNHSKGSVQFKKTLETKHLEIQELQSQIEK